MIAFLSAWRWPLIVVAFLLGNVGTQGALYVYATRDPSHAVESDYYRKAVAYDARAEEERRSAALGWTVEVAALRPRIVVGVRDASGRPLDGATVRVEAFQNARASETSAGACEARGGGRYEAPFGASAAGLWILRIDAARGADRFACERRVDAPGPPPGEAR
jgi:nitrogen fixation protein FixH